jgi:hypothetical protein
MPDYTYAKKAELYDFQGFWDAICAKNTFCIINYKPRKLVHLKCNEVIVGNQEVSKFQWEGKILHVFSINPETITRTTAM